MMALPPAAEEDVIFFNLPVLGFVSYSLGWALLLAVSCALTWLAALVVGRARAKLRLSEVTLGALAALIVLLAAAAAPFAAWTVLARVHVTHGWGNPTLSGTYLLALLALATAVSLAWYQLAGRWGAPMWLAAGGLLPWVLLTLLLAALEPAASYPLAWPLLFASVALAISVGTNGRVGRLIELLSEWLAVIVGGAMLAQWVWLPFFGLGLQGLTAA